jgi:WXG100 family type VII secretion target
MAGEKDRMEYPKVRKMAREFANASKALDKSISQMKKASKTINSGALQGDAGSAFEDALKSKLVPALTKLKAKMDEMNTDVTNAVDAMEKGVSKARSPFT